MWYNITRSNAEHPILYAGMAELADALDSGSSGGNFVKVQVLLPAPKKEEQAVRFGLPFFVFLQRT